MNNKLINYKKILLSNHFQPINNELVDFLIITIIWVLMIAVVNPWGNFPLNDDWVYAKAVKSIIEERNFTLSEAHSASNLIVQAFWGALFCLPFGFSYTALRFSSLILGLIGILITYAILREIKACRFYCILGALLIGLNPIYFALSNTFMTDIPFFSTAILSVYFLIKGLKDDSILNISIGIFLSYCSLLIRQNGIIIAVSFTFAYLVGKKINIGNVIKSFLPTLLGILIQLFYQYWLAKTHRNSPAHNLQVNRIKEIIFSDDLKTIFDNFFNNTLIALIYIGLFLAPLIYIQLINNWQSIKSSEKRFFLFTNTVILTIIGIWLLTIKKQIMPLSENLLLNFGIGPLTFHDTYYLRKNIPLISVNLQITWILLTIIGAIGASLLIYYFSKINLKIVLEIIKQTTKLSSEEKINIFVTFCILTFYIPMGIQGYFERYLLLLLPLFMIQIVTIFRNKNKIDLNFKKTLSISVIMLILGIFTVGATHDYLSWNRVRWQVLNNLTDRLYISPNRIDGGYEFNGSYLYSTDYQEKQGKSWWWVDKDDYILSFGSLDGYQEIQRYYFDKILPFGPKYFLVLKKQ